MRGVYAFLFQQLIDPQQEIPVCEGFVSLFHSLFKITLTMYVRRRSHIKVVLGGYLGPGLRSCSQSQRFCSDSESVDF